MLALLGKLRHIFYRLLRFYTGIALSLYLE